MRLILFIFSFILWHFGIQSQTCLKPYGIKFSNRTQTGTQVQWNDNNPQGQSYEIEIVQFGNVRKGEATHSTFEKTILLNTLNNSTSYEFYIRTKCLSGNVSDWNGPFSFYTELTNPTPCMTSLPLKDNGTETYTIRIDDIGKLGDTKTIENIKTIIEHGWPADLKITLESPSGRQVTLSKHHGTLFDDYGNIEDLNCQEVTAFSSFACTKIKDNQPPFIGYFLPEDDIDEILSGESINGIWKIIVHDRAVNDKGILKYFSVEFSDNTCIQPKNVSISEVKTNSVLLSWIPYPNCKSLTLEIIDPIGDTIVKKISCQEQNYLINDLLPNTDYILTLRTECENKIERKESCPLHFSTLCEPITMQESFDDQISCNAGCSESCQYYGNIFSNAIEDGLQDWIVWEGASPNENTGPENGVNDKGKYVYVDNNGLVCGTQNTVILVSNCLNIKSNASECDFSFYYHMFGVDIGSLSVQISLDLGESWEILDEINSNIKDDWLRKTLSLKKYDGKYAIIRFVAITTPGVAGDIALDQIEFYGTTLATDGHRYFIDKDHDDYGNDTTSVYLCTSIPPEGFASLGGDCNDENPNIHPDAAEIECNGLDENCNGFGDELPPENFITYSSNVTDALCTASQNGKIFLNVSGGNPPYDIQWNQGGSGAELKNLSQGFYNATITDFGGCKLVTDYFRVQSTSILLASVSQINKASCLGKSDGNIFIVHNNNFPPYSYDWSNGQKTINALNIPQGAYSVTITDSLGCATTIQNIEVSSNSKISGNIKSIQEPLCFGQEKGYIEFEVSNGNPPYEYNWNNGNSSPSIENVSSGIYTITVTDSNDCIFTQSITLSQPDSLYATIVDIVPNICFGRSEGQILTKPIGGTAPYYFLWSNGAQSDDIYGLVSGDYRLTLTDNNGCEAIPISAKLTDPAQLMVSIDSLSPATCLLSRDAYLSINLKGGVVPYQIVWNHDKTDSTELFNISAGIYGFTGIDANSCKFSLENIEVPHTNKNVEIDTKKINNNACFGDSLNLIIVNINSTFSPFDYNWSVGSQYFTNSNKDTLSRLGGGTYALTITDNIGCVGVSDEIIFPIIDPITYTTEELLQNICPQDSTGSIHIKISSYNTIDSIVWNSNPELNGVRITNLPVGKYQAKIVDINGCMTLTDSIQVSATENIIIDSTIVHDTDNTGDGSICLEILSNNTPYYFLWENGIENNCISKLKLGRYTVTITDGIGCEFIEHFDISNLNSIEEVQSKIELFPTMSKDYFYLNFDNRFRIDLELYNYFGELVFSQDDVCSHCLVDVSNLLPGHYFIKIKEHKSPYFFLNFLKY
ncbi:MAG: MopE-related protein [Saprospiraceae bacterium]